MREPMIFAALLMTGALTAFSSSGSQRTQTQGAQDRVAQCPLVVITGAQSEAARGCDLATTEEEWIRLWQRHRGVPETGVYNAYYNEIGMPLVDFSRCVVVAVFQGQAWNSAGFEAEVGEEEGRVRLRLSERFYQTVGPDGGGQRVSAHGFFVLPRTDKELLVEEAVLGKKGETPTWRQRRVFAKTGH